MGADWEFAHGNGPDKAYVAGGAPLTEFRLEHWLKLKPMDDGLWWLRVGDARVMVRLSGEHAVVDIIRGFYGPVEGTTENCGATPKE